MQAQVILRKITGAAAHFAELHQRAGFYRDPRSDCGLLLFIPTSLNSTR